VVHYKITHLQTVLQVTPRKGLLFDELKASLLNKQFPAFHIYRLDTARTVLSQSLALNTLRAADKL
jgi:hypothetical protein